MPILPDFKYAAEHCMPDCGQSSGWEKVECKEPCDKLLDSTNGLEAASQYLKGCMDKCLAKICPFPPTNVEMKQALVNAINLI